VTELIKIFLTDTCLGAGGESGVLSFLQEKRNTKTSGKQIIFLKNNFTSTTIYLIT
jgi:hypothetical protein